MELVSSQQGDRLTLTISGKCTVEHAAALRDALLEASAQGKALALDLSGVEDVDITLLQLLLATAQTMEKRGTCIVRVGPLSHAVSEAARVSGFDQTPRLKPFFADEGQPCPRQVA